MTATVGADGAPWTESGFEGPGAPVALGQSSTGAFVATGIPHAGEHTLVAVPFGENTSRAEFDDGSTPADVEVTEDGRIVTFGHLGNAMAVSTYDESLAMTAQFTAIPPGMTFPRVHDAVVSDDEIITAGSYVVNTDLEKRFFVARVPLSELVPTARPPAVEEDQLEDEPETEPELGMRVLKKRLPRTVGTLLNWGAIAKVTCAGHCLVTMKLLTRGRAACELGVSGVVGRGQLGLWPGETGKVGAYLTDRARRKLGAATDYATRVKTRVRFAVEPLP